MGPRVEDYSDPLASSSLLHSLGIKVTAQFETNSDETRKRMVLDSYGYSVLPIYMIEDEVKKGKLHLIKVKKRIGLNVFLVKKVNRTLSKAAQVFEAYLKSHISSHVDSE